MVHDNLSIWQPCQTKIFERWQSEFSLKICFCTTLFHIIPLIFLVVIVGKLTTYIVPLLWYCTHAPAKAFTKQRLKRFKINNTSANDWSSFSYPKLLCQHQVWQRILDVSCYIIIFLYISILIFWNGSAKAFIKQRLKRLNIKICS